MTLPAFAFRAGRAYLPFPGDRDALRHPSRWRADARAESPTPPLRASRALGAASWKASSTIERSSPDCRRRWLQDHRRKRGQREADGELAVMPVDLLGAHDARRGLGGEAAISFGVAVEQQGVGDGIRDTDAVVGA